MNFIHQTCEKNQKAKVFNYVTLLFIILAMVSFSGCGSDGYNTGTDDGNMNGEEQEANEVWMVGQTFNVSNLEITAGTTVTWTNQSSLNHTVTSGNRGSENAGDLFDSGTIGPGETFSYTFEEAGSYDYFCEIHPGMAAEVTVTEE